MKKKENYPTAIEYYKKSISDDHPLPANIKTYRNLANIYFLTGKNTEAEEYYKKSIALSRKLFGANHPETALCQLSYARYLFQTKKFRESLALLKLSEKFYKSRITTDSRELSVVYVVAGNNYLGMSNPVLAEQSADLAIKSILKTNDNITEFLLNTPDEKLLPDQLFFNALHLKAAALYEKSKEYKSTELLVQSLALYELSAKLIHKIRAGYQSQESRMVITGAANDIYPDAIKCALELYNRTANNLYLEKAFSFSEQSKAAVLLSSLRELEARQVGQIPVDLQKKEKALKQSLDSYNQLVYDEKLTTKPNFEKISLWEKKLFELNIRYDSLLQAFDRQYPEYYRLRFGFDVVSLSELRQKLNIGQSLISYTIDEQVLYTFAITSDTALCHIQTLPPNFDSTLSKFRNHLAVSDLSKFTSSDFVEFTKNACNLYKILIGPVAEVLKNDRLIIVPDHQLGYLPFEVLITKESDNGSVDFKNLPYLITYHPISYSYSATLLFKHFRDIEQKSSGILAFAPDYRKIPQDKITTNQREELLPIPWATTESKNITSSYRGRAYLDQSATESAFKQNAPGFNVLHLAMHTLIDNENPLYSKLVFSSQKDTLDDGFLSTYELFNIKLNADLAVLSACKTGDGRLNRGEGIMSLARGFYYAGVPSIVMTLWSVDDFSSSELVTLFYKFLSKGYQKDQALQMAKVSYLAQSDQLKSHPKFWAGFVNIGNTEPVSIQKAQPIVLYILTGVILFGAIIFLIARKRRQQR